MLKYWPILVTAGALIAGGAVAQLQIASNDEQLGKHGEMIEENEEDIEAIQRRLIERQGKIELDLDRLRNEQQDQSEKLDEVLDLLRRSQ